VKWLACLIRVQSVVSLHPIKGLINCCCYIEQDILPSLLGMY